MKKMENRYYMVGEDTFYERDGDRWFYYFVGEKKIETGFLDYLEINELFEPLQEKQFRKELDLRVKFFSKNVAQ